MNNPSIKEVQDAILVIRKFADENDYTLCRPYLKGLVKEFCNVLDIILNARDWEPVE